MTVLRYETELGTEIYDPLSEYGGRFIPRDRNVARYLLLRGLGLNITLEQIQNDASLKVSENIILGSE